METIRKVRHAYHRQGRSIRDISEAFHMSRNTVRKILRSDEIAFEYRRGVVHKPKLGPFIEALERRLEEDAALPTKGRRTARRLFEELVGEGYDGAYDSVRRHVRTWKQSRRLGHAKVFVPLAFDAGEAFQFDWSHEDVELGGLPHRVKVAQFTLCHSRMPFIAAFPRETLEMVLEAHNQAFAFFGGSCTKGIYDNMKTAVHKLLRGRDRGLSLRFEKMCSHHLFEPVFCTPASAWEKGRVERQVLTTRMRRFTPRLRCADLRELNARLLEETVADARRRKHPDMPDKTVWEVFQEERHALCGPFQPFDACTETDVAASTTSLVRYDHNRYSVAAAAAGRTVQLRAYAGRIVVLSEGKVVAEHDRRFGRGHVVFDPWHYLPVLERKPGALRNGMPFKEWELPPSLSEMRRRLEATRKDWDKEFVEILCAVPRHGLEAVEEACTKALSMGAIGAAVVMNLLNRSMDEEPPPPMKLDERYRLVAAPTADCLRYEALLGGIRAAQ